MSENTEQPLRGGILLKALPVMALLAWIAALGIAALYLNRPPYAGLADGDTIQLYGWAAPGWMFILLSVLSLAAMVAAMVRPGLGYPFAAAGLLVPLGTGDRLLVGDGLAHGDLLGAMLFAGALLLLVEFISAVPRFNSIVRSSQGLAQDERGHVNRFIVRYVGMSIALGIVYTALAFLLAGEVFPWIGERVSLRMSDGIEMRTALGITLFSMIFLSIPILIRMIIDGFSGSRATDDEEAST